jgi:hypothetical protein
MALLERVFLGYSMTRFKDGLKRVPVFVVWLNDPEASMTAQLPDVLACPSCGRPVNLADRIKSDATFQQPEIFSTATRCGECGTVLHFDKTPSADRAGLAWTQRFEKA